MSDSETTLEKHKGLIPWKPGQSGNPAGRPKGSRNKLGEALIEALVADFDEHGKVAIVATRTERPHEYLKIIASLLPKELKISNESDLTDDQILERLHQLDAALRPLLGAPGTAGVGDGAKPPAVTH